MDCDHKMSRDEWVMFSIDKKRFQMYEKNRYYCYCGHSVTIRPKEQRTFCTHCGHWVYKDKRKQKENIKKIKMEDFRNKVMEVMKNENTTR